MTSPGVPGGDTTLLQRLTEAQRTYERERAERDELIERHRDRGTAVSDARYRTYMANQRRTKLAVDALPAVVTLIEAAHRHIEDEAADAIAVRALETDENVTAAQQHQRGTRQRANESFGVLCVALAPFVGEATQ